MLTEDKLPSWKNTLKELGEFVAELLKVVVISLVIILPIRYYVVQPFYVKGASMEPTFLNNEYLLIDELSYHFSKPERGSVIVFRYPKDPSQFFIKRIIGLPGDTVKVKDAQVTIVNDKYPEGLVLSESYINKIFIGSNDYQIDVPDNHYFLMGDNRGASLDSRVFGPVSDNLIIGRVWVRAWPFDRWTLFSN